MSREAITSWLLDQGEQVTGLRELTQALCAQWLQAGFAVDRVNLVFCAPPRDGGCAVVWGAWLDEAIEIAVRREDMDTPMYLNSPIHWLVERGGSFVADLRRPESAQAPSLGIFERGFEAYFGERIDYGDGGVAVLSVCSPSRSPLMRRRSRGCGLSFRRSSCSSISSRHAGSLRRSLRPISDRTRVSGSCRGRFCVGRVSRSKRRFGSVTCAASRKASPRRSPRVDPGDERLL